jgi:predicted MFS family arabinose efflux permease
LARWRPDWRCWLSSTRSSGARRRPAWGNAVGLLAFLTETSLVFLLTLYLQKVLGFSPLAAGLSFGVLGLGTVTGGSFAPRIIARVGTRAALIGGGVVQAASTFALLGLTTSAGGSLTLLLVTTFTGGVGNMLVIVGFMITATSGLPDREQGLATGLATMTQQIGITMGTPIMSAIATGAMASTAAAAVLHGVGIAVAVNAVLVLVGTAIAVVGLRGPRAAA